MRRIAKKSYRNDYIHSEGTHWCTLEGTYTLNVIDSVIFKLSAKKDEQQVDNHKIFFIKNFRTLKHLETTRFHSDFFPI